MAHGHTASMQKSQDLNLGSLNCWITSKKEEKETKSNTKYEKKMFNFTQIKETQLE